MGNRQFFAGEQKFRQNCGILDIACINEEFLRGEQGLNACGWPIVIRGDDEFTTGDRFNEFGDIRLVAPGNPEIGCNLFERILIIIL